MHEAFLCLGGNLGNCVETFERSLSILVSRRVVIHSKSSVYRSKAWGMENAPDFFNQVVKIKTSLSARQLLGALLEIETQLGRTRTEGTGYESRSIDIDILLFDEDVIEEPGLHIPHPRMHLRRFVLEPLCEIAPHVVHPVLKKTALQLISECPDPGELKKITHAV